MIDLQSNTGGQEELAIDAFKHFFPTTDVFAGNRLRISDKANTLGYSITQFMQQYIADPASFNQTYQDSIIADPWAVLNEINPDTGRYFSSWGEYAPPVDVFDDQFSVIVGFCSEDSYEYWLMIFSRNTTTLTQPLTA